MLHQPRISGYTNHDKLTSAGLALYFTGFPVVGRTKTETARWTTWALVTTHLESAGKGWDGGKAEFLEVSTAVIQKLHLKHSNLDQKNGKPSLCPLCHIQSCLILISQADGTQSRPAIKQKPCPGGGLLTSSGWKFLAQLCRAIHVLILMYNGGEYLVSKWPQKKHSRAKILGEEQHSIGRITKVQNVNICSCFLFVSVPRCTFLVLGKDENKPLTKGINLCSRGWSTNYTKFPKDETWSTSSR